MHFLDHLGNLSELGSLRQLVSLTSYETLIVVFDIL